MTLTYRNVKYVLLFIFVFCANSIFAEMLNFKQGDSALYQISRNLDLKGDFMGTECNVQKDEALDFEVTILSANEDSSVLFPMEIQVVVKRIQFVQYDSLGNYKSYKYDSDSDYQSHKRLARRLAKVIDKPLIFKVDSLFEVTEMTDYLADLYEDFYESSILGETVFGTDVSDYEDIFSGMFHLVGEDCQEGKSCDVSIYNEDDEDEIVEQNGYYTITSIDSDSMKADLNGTLSIFDTEVGSVVKGDINGTTEWNLANPLNQHRHTHLNIELRSGPVTFNAQATETWHSVAQ